jgi:hypothetical protein
MCKNIATAGINIHAIIGISAEQGCGFGIPKSRICYVPHLLTVSKSISTLFLFPMHGGQNLIIIVG